MENRRKMSCSGEIFSFPNTPNQEQDSDFEFGCLTPDSPSQDPSRNSPADHLFFNGKLLPHSFPCQQPPTAASIIDNIYRATSRTSSVSSKDSLMSSRSNSTNSRSSSCSSARTSSSDNSERKLLYYNRAAYKTTTASKMVTAQLYGSSQRWQYLTPVPALKRDVSQRKNCGVLLKEELRSKSQREKKKNSERTTGTCRRFFMSFLFACRECHAMEPSTKDDVLQENNMKL
ncbi:Membrane-associated kinase regulator [Melia azedarach]|uniref:Membrane-associated kinase regulator n=1 Tax=Melia azedarach TaxID=155640 RepID=A0ACC1YSB4_MELAZ|nr:Membrane-associated kinase regulator [Melia azedarach]